MIMDGPDRPAPTLVATTSTVAVEGTRIAVHAASVTKVGELELIGRGDNLMVGHLSWREPVDWPEQVQAVIDRLLTEAVQLADARGAALSIVAPPGSEATLRAHGFDVAGEWWLREPVGS